MSNVSYIVYRISDGHIKRTGLCPAAIVLLQARAGEGAMVGDASTLTDMVIVPPSPPPGALGPPIQPNIDKLPDDKIAAIKAALAAITPPSVPTPDGA